jgi:hypothetical protein
MAWQRGDPAGLAGAAPLDADACEGFPPRSQIESIAGGERAGLGTVTRSEIDEQLPARCAADDNYPGASQCPDCSAEPYKT